MPTGDKRMVRLARASNRFRAEQIQKLRSGSATGTAQWSAPALIYSTGSIATIVSVVVLSAATSQSSFVTTGIAVALLFCALGMVLVFGIGGRASIGPIISFVTLSQLLMFVGRPFYSSIFQDSENIFTGAPYGASFVVAQLIAGAGFLALCLGYVLGFRQTASALSPDLFPIKFLRPMSGPAWVHLRTLLQWVTVAGGLLYLLFIAQAGLGTYWQTLLSGRSQEYAASVQNSSGYLLSGLQFATGALLFFYLQAWIAKNFRAQLLSLAGLALAAVPDLAAGSRSTFIPVALALLVMVSRGTPKLLLIRRALLWLPPFYVLALIAPRIWRVTLSRGGSFGESIQQALAPDELFGQFFGGYDTAMIDAFQVQVAAHAQGALSLQHGSTYIAALASWVPRSIWPNKPLSVDQLLNSELFPETAAKKIGFAFGFYSEPLFNFGPVGVLIVAVFFGSILGRVAGRAISSSEMSPAFTHALVAGFSFVIMRGSISFDSQRLLMVLLPVIFCAWWVALLQPTGPRPAHGLPLKSKLHQRKATSN